MVGPEPASHHLPNQGKTIRQIAAIVRTGFRQIRIIRERLYDLRANALEPVGAD